MYCKHLARVGRHSTRLVLLAAALVATTACDNSARRAEVAQARIHQRNLSDYVDQIDAALKPYVNEQASRLSVHHGLATKVQQPLQHLPIAESHRQALVDVYAQRHFEPLFTDGRTLNADGVVVAQTMIAADAHGLRASDFLASEISEAIARTQTREDLPVIDGELRLTERDREIITAWLFDRVGNDGTLPDLTATLDQLAATDGTSPLPDLADSMASRAAAHAPALDAASDLELLLADAWLRWSIAQRFHNLRYITTDMAHARGWRILVDGEVYSTKQPGSPRKEPEIDPAKLTDIDADDLALLLATEYLTESANLGNLEAALHAIAPPFEDYRRLVRGAQQYRELVRRGGWAPVSLPIGLKVGSQGPRVVELKRRLAAEEYYSGDLQSDIFGDDLRRALLNYQDAHQLMLKGEITEETLESLNVPAERRLAQILVTMQHWRDTRIGEDYSDQYIVVNVPDFHAELWDKGERITRFKTIVGRPRRFRDASGTLQTEGRTPLFSDELQYIVFNPYWNVPQSIWREEYAAKIAADPEWLTEKGFEIIQTSEGGQMLRQLPSPNNALGLVKFLFPNEHDVYLHDTNRRDLFTSHLRAFSHGCVRVEGALDFAVLLTQRDKNISREAAQQFVDNMLAREGEQWTTLKTYIPVHVEYFAVRGDDEGRTQFLSDIHRTDAPLVDAWEAEIRAYFENLNAESAQL